MIARYSRPEMTRLFTDEARLERWLEVELCACRSMEVAGIVPAGTAADVQSKVKLDPARVLEIEARTRHDVIAFLEQVEESAGPPARFLHRGMTSSDVVDTALALGLVRALDLCAAGLDRLRTVCARRAREHAKTPMIGRSHGIHAEPTSLGLTFALWFQELGRGADRIARARAAVAVGKLSGAVGVLAHYGPEVEERALGELGLTAEPVATQVVQRDRHAELHCALGLLAATLEKMATSVRHWQRTEVGEAEEFFEKGQQGSSAMPHKRNPILSENLCGLARLVRAYVTPALENVALWHERDISHSSVERVATSDALILVDFMLDRMTRLIDRLVVYPERMKQNLELTRGCVFSEAILLLLVDAGLGRQAAYKIVQRHAHLALAGGPTLEERLVADEEVRGHLSEPDIRRAFDLSHHLRHVDALLHRALGPAA
jgi:adenylosuccinate lyase